jgi:hypothetical protein
MRRAMQSGGTRFGLPPDRHAAAYGNERQVGEAVLDSRISRSEVFLETKTEGALRTVNCMAI